MFEPPRIILNNIAWSSGYPLLIQSPGVSYGHTRGSPTCINRTAANGGLVDGLIYGRLWVQGGRRHTNAHPLYSFSNGTVSPFWLRGI